MGMKVVYEDQELGFVNIDDTQASGIGTYSSGKIETLLENKQDKLAAIDGTVTNSNPVATKSTVNSALTDYDKTTIDKNSPLSDVNITYSNSKNGGNNYYYVNADTANLPSAWTASSTRGILKTTNISGVLIQELTLWGYANTTTYASKSGKFLRSSYYNNSKWIWETWKTISL